MAVPCLLPQITNVLTEADGRVATGPNCFSKPIKTYCAALSRSSVARLWVIQARVNFSCTAF